MYCWGSCSNGELGLGGIEEQTISEPRRCKFERSDEVATVSCGINHTVFIFQDGSVYTCGANDLGQLGHNKSCTRPGKVDALSNQVIKSVSCGNSFTIAINQCGQLFAWGSNSNGQLGIEGAANGKIFVSYPKMIKSIGTLNVVQVSCGHDHSLALTSSGAVYSWGTNLNGQLGMSTKNIFLDKPSVVQALGNIPLRQIAAGGNHSFALTVSGSVFGWGRNHVGQLGIENLADKTTPTLLGFLHRQKICKICCGEDHCVALTVDGRIFTWGAGTYGQLGNNLPNNEFLPRQVIELMGSFVAQIACGRRHTLVYVPSSNTAHAFGLGGSGQLGNGNLKSALSPVLVKGPWSNGHQKGNLANSPPNHVAFRIFSGGAQNFLLTKNISDEVIPLCNSVLFTECPILCLKQGTIETWKDYPEASQIPDGILKDIETIFSSGACLNSSYLVKDEHFICNSVNHGVDLALARKEFHILSTQVKNPRFTEVIGSCLEKLLGSLSALHDESLRILMILPNCHLFMMPEIYINTIIDSLAHFLNNLPLCHLATLGSWWAVSGASSFLCLVEIYKGAIAFCLQQHEYCLPNRFWNKAHKYFTVLLVLHELNLAHENIISCHQFYIPEVTTRFDLRNAYLEWMRHEPFAPNICEFPFVFDAKAKVVLLESDATLQMMNAVGQSATVNCHLNRHRIAADTHLVLTINRSNLVEDTLNQLVVVVGPMLKRPLRVIFIDEEAQDEGGVRKEFFLLLIKELLNPNYGMFTRTPQTSNLWFCENSLEDGQMFFLIGIVCGLVIYNFNIIDLPFPLVLYKKLLGRETKLDDLCGLYPEMVHSFKYMLEDDTENFENIYDLTFEITRERFGETTTHELKSGGRNIAVNQNNKQEYIDLYVDYILNKSIEKEYVRFHEGLHKVCGGKILNLFQPEELMEMIIGSENYDWQEFEKNATYKNGFSANHMIIQWFWIVFHSLNQVGKKKFLMFLSGSDRIPISGMRDVPICIQPLIANDNYLPIAHTCFNLLDLPKYTSQETLRTKLLRAIESPEGFGIL